MNGKSHTGKILTLVITISLLSNILFFMPGSEVKAQSDTWVVNSIEDTGAGSGMSGDLRYAITQAQAAGGGTITFESAFFNISSTITLQSQLPVIDINSGTLVIQGPGKDILTVSGSNQYQIFKINSGNVTISGLTLANGKSLGSNGAVGSKGTSSAKDGGSGGSGGIAAGGGVYNAGTLTVSNCVFFNNSTVGGTGGTGGNGYDGWDIDYGGSGGSGGSGGNGYGGGVYNAGTLIVSNSSFSGNNAKGGSGGIGGNCGTDFSFKGSVGGSGGSGFGGAIYSTGPLTIESSTFSGDSATGGNGNSGGMPFFGGPAGNGGQGGAGYGGAVCNSGTLTVSIINSLFSNDNATGGTGGTGGMYNPAIGNSSSGDGGDGGGGCGGALYNAGTMMVYDSTFSGYSAVGGTGGLGMTSFTMNANFGGKGGNGGSGGNGWGGALSNSGTLTISNGTFSSGSAAGGSGGAGGDGQRSSTSGGGEGQGGNGGNGGNGLGGTLYNAGALNISISSFSGGIASAGAAGSAGKGGILDLYPPPYPSSFTEKNTGAAGSAGSCTAKSFYNGSSAVSLLNSYIETGNDNIYGAINVVSISPSNVKADGSSQITATSILYDTSGTPIQGASVAFSTSLGYLLTPSPILTDANGTAQDKIFSGAVGTSTVYVQASGYPDVSMQVCFTAGTPVNIFTISGTPQITFAGRQFGSVMKALVWDKDNNPVSGVTVTFTAPSSGASGTFANGTNTASVTTDAQGIATSPVFTANSTTGNYTVYASFSGVGAPAGFSLHNIRIATPQINSSTGAASITTSDHVTLNAGILSNDEDIFYTTDGNSTFSGEPSSINGCIKYQDPIALPQGNYTIAAAVYSSYYGCWGDAAIAGFTVNAAVSSHTVTVSANPASGGTVNGGGIYNEGASTTVTATPNSGYHFINWTEGGSPVNTSSSFTFTMGTSDRTLTANFIPVYIVSFNTDGGSAVSSQGIPCNGKAARPAEPSKSGYAFAGWYGDSSLTTLFDFSNTAITEDMIIYAKWAAVTLQSIAITTPASKMTYTVGDSLDISGMVVTGSYNDNSAKIETITTSNVSGFDSSAPAASQTLTVTIGSKTSTYAITIKAASNNTDRGTGSGISTQQASTKTDTSVSGNTITATTSTAATTDSSGNATAAVTHAQVSDAVGKAIEEAAKQGEGIAAAVEINVTAPSGVISVETSIPKAAVSEIADSNKLMLEISTQIASLTFDINAISTISQSAAGDVKITASKVDTSTLPEEARQVVGDRPVFNFSVTSGNNTISQFGGNVSVSVPYLPKAGEDTNAIVICYINAEGKIEIVSNCMYDTATGSITFNTSHFSRYAVGYNKVSFKDVTEDAWYYKAVSFIAARSITEGTGNGIFSPQAKLTRAEFLVMLMRAYGMSPDENQADNFSDSGNTYYSGYLAKAKRLGISGGVGNNMFAPDMEITRQEMFVLLYNTLNILGELPDSSSGQQLSAFSDAGEIAIWARDAMTLLVKTGIISGNDGRILPANTTTRAEMVQVLYNLLAKK